MAKKLCLYLCTCFAVLASVGLSAYPIGYKSYTEWEKLPQLRFGAVSGMASSYDRTGGNHDWSYYEWPTGAVSTETVCRVQTINGPGVIYRFWMPHVMANDGYVVKMFFDNDSTLLIDTWSNLLFNGGFSYFDEPMITTVAGGQVCNEIIPFKQRVIIETVNHQEIDFADRHYYQYSYMTYPPGTDVNSFSSTLSPQDQNDRDEVVSIFDNAGQNPAGQSAAAVDVNIGTTAIDANFVLLDANGPGVVRELRLQMPDANDMELAGLNLQVFYDGDANSAIDIPVMYFFGAGKQRADYNSLPLGADVNDGFYCYWPMPFRESIIIQLSNTTANPIAINSAQIEYELKELEHHTCYLHAIENYTVRTSQTYHTILNTTGVGHFVGDFVYLEQDYNNFEMLEGDDIIYTDGELVQYGTGLEDVYNGGAYYNWYAAIPSEPEGAYPQSATRPLSGLLYCNKSATSRADQYRWRIADCVPFSESIEVKVECRYSLSGARWRSVGFWYELPHRLEDLNQDGIVDFLDFARFAGHWMADNPDECGYADFTGEYAVDWEDMALFAEVWLAE